MAVNVVYFREERLQAIMYSYVLGSVLAKNAMAGNLVVELISNLVTC